MRIHPTEAAIFSMSANPERQGTLQFEMCCSASGQMLQLARNLVELVCRHYGVTTQTLAEIEMAVDEACSNVWLHAYPVEEAGAAAGGAADAAKGATEPGSIHVRVCAKPSEIEITISDEGIGWRDHPGVCAHKGVESLEDYYALRENHHGLGTLIIQRFMDEVEYHFPPDRGTVLRMKKRLEASPQAG